MESVELTVKGKLKMENIELMKAIFSYFSKTVHRFKIKDHGEFDLLNNQSVFDFNFCFIESLKSYMFPVSNNQCDVDNTPIQHELTILFTSAPPEAPEFIETFHIKQTERDGNVIFDWYLVDTRDNDLNHVITLCMPKEEYLKLKLEHM